MGHAGVVAVVHEVGDRVLTGVLRAGVASLGATGGGLSLVRGVVDMVPRALTAVLERVEEPQPVPDLVGAGVALVESFLITPGRGAVRRDDAGLVECVLP